MEFHIPKKLNDQSFQESFTFCTEDLDDIPCPDDICVLPEGSLEEDNADLPLPPGTSPYEFPDLSLPPDTSPSEFPDLPLPPGTSPSEFPELPLPPGISSSEYLELPVAPGISCRKTLELPSPGTSPREIPELPLSPGISPIEIPESPPSPGTSPSEFPELPLPPGISSSEFLELHLPPGTSGRKIPELPSPSGTSPRKISGSSSPPGTSPMEIPESPSSPGTSSMEIPESPTHGTSPKEIPESQPPGTLLREICKSPPPGTSPREISESPPPGTSSKEIPALLLPPGTLPREIPELPLPPGTSPSEFPGLPLPPGISPSEFPTLLPSKPVFVNYSNDFYPFYPQCKAFESNSTPLGSAELYVLSSEQRNQQTTDFKVNEFQGNITGKPAEFIDVRYSPSKMDSDEENQDFVTIKPKVLGKEQAKKRLMAFSLTKQPGTLLKKQNKVINPARNKEKPPNPNKSTKVQEQFRATITAIEEEKKKMLQNMPSYLLLEMSELAKSHSSMSSSMQLLEKLKTENASAKNKDSSSKNGSSKTKSSDRKRRQSSHKSRSRSKSKKTKRNESRRRTKSSPSRRRRRSHSRSHSKRSRGKKYKSEKTTRKSRSGSKKKFEDWKSLKVAGQVHKSEPEVSKKPCDEFKSHRDEHCKRSRSPKDRTDSKPVPNSTDKGCSLTTFFQAKSANSSSSTPVLFLEKAVKYTKMKPAVCWSDSKSRASESHLSKQMLLEDCDESTGSIFLSIIENKTSPLLKEDKQAQSMSEALVTKSRLWYPRHGLVPDLVKSHQNLKANESHPIGSSGEEEEENIKKVCESEIKEADAENFEKGSSIEKKVSLVNDSYLSDEDQIKEIIIGEVKVQLDLDMNLIRVCSKWDSDYEAENSEKESIFSKKQSKKLNSNEVRPQEPTSQTKSKLKSDLNVETCTKTGEDFAGKNKSASLYISNVKAPSADSSVLNASTGKLVSEYEEFLKIVSSDTSNTRNNLNEKVITESIPKTETMRTKKVEKLSEGFLNVGGTDWDQESDHEDQSVSKKMQFISNESHDEILILRKKESLDAKLGKINKEAQIKKTERLKSKKSLKKSGKTKKKEIKDSYSEDDSSSDSYESDSESDSDASDSSQKKIMKNLTNKKRSKKDFSSESDNDSNDSKTKKKKSVKKKSKKKSSSSDDNSEAPISLLIHTDFEKQLIMKNIEGIDSISVKSGKKEVKEKRGKKKDKETSEETDSDKYIKLEKKKKTQTKIEKDKKKFKPSARKGERSGRSRSSNSKSDSESSDDSLENKKEKKSRKRKGYSSESSDSEENKEKFKLKSSKTSKKLKSNKRSSKSSESDDSDSSLREKKKAKKEKIKIGNEKSDKIREDSFKDNLLLVKPDIKPEKHSKLQKLLEKPEKKIKKTKEDDDWEASSSVEESEPENQLRENSWDEEDEAPKIKVSVYEGRKSEETRKSQILQEKEINFSTDTSEANQFASETLKTSLSNFSFNENSFCSFGQELSRDFFLAERNYSNSGHAASSESLRTTLIDPRPFQSVNKDSECKKPSDSERYSPGHSDSELSDVEIRGVKVNSVSNIDSGAKVDVYDPLNCESEGSAENNEIELSSIPLPHVPDVFLPEPKSFEKASLVSSSEGSACKDLPQKEEISSAVCPRITSPVKSSFVSSEFTPVPASQLFFNQETNTQTKRQLMSVKGQQKLISKAASVFQDESDEENIEPSNKEKEVALGDEGLKQKTDEDKSKKEEKQCEDEKDVKKHKKETHDISKERSKEREGRRRRSRSRESRDSNKIYSRKTSPSKRRKSRTPEPNREKREIRSDSFEIEPLQSSNDMVRPIPVLTGLEAPSLGLWNRSLASSCEYLQGADNLIEHAESFDIYPSEESIHNRNCGRDYEKSSTYKRRNQKSRKERRKSRSRSYSPRKKVRSKSPERRKSPRNRSPRRKSTSPKRRDKSPFSPRRKSPKRKSPSRRHKRKSPSRSPRKRRGSPSRRSRSNSPRKYRSPKRRDESPRRTLSPRDRFSPRKDTRYSQSYSNGLHNRIPVIGDCDMELSPSAMRSPYENPMGFLRHIPDSSVVESEMYSSFYEGEYTNEFGMSSYSEDVGVNNLITLKNHDIEKTNSPERLSLDQRIELELGVQMSGSHTGNDQYQMQNHVCPSFQDTHFQNSYNCDNSNDNFYQNQNVQINTDFNGQYFNGHQQQAPSSYGSFQQYSQPVQNAVMQVGNIVEVVPTLQHPPPPPPPLPSKAPQIMQVGNVLQVVPSQKATPQVLPHNYVPSDASPQVKTQKATAVVAPSSIIPTPNPEVVLNPLIKAIQLEREKRKQEKEKRKVEREARRKARQLRREAKLMLVNEKLKKSVQDEGLMLGQEVEDDELLEGLDVPSPPVPVEIITVSSVSTLPPAGKGILITAGFMPKPPSEKKEVKFADGVCPGEGTSTSGDEDIASPPPKPKLPKEKRFKKKKTKMKKKVKVQIIRQIIQEEDDEDDDLSPPPPPPGDPPLVFFARFPFASNAQFPVYQTQTTTTTLTTVQYPAQTFE